MNNENWIIQIHFMQMSKRLKRQTKVNLFTKESNAFSYNFLLYKNEFYQEFCYMSNSTLKILLKEYEQKRLNAISDLEDRKNNLYNRCCK